jgi:cytidylate kinase
MIPVVTIDGPSGTGKGTIAGLLARRLGWHCLDSGALYRVVGLAARHRGIDLAATEELVDLIAGMSLEFRDERVYLGGEDVSDAIRTEEAGNAASRVAAQAGVRTALLDWQRCAARSPGLVADGRDMGSVVFPDAPLKIYLSASPEERARRRHKQLKEKGLDVSLPQLAREIAERDERDRQRSVAPLVAPAGALVLDTTSLGIDEVLERVVEAAARVFPEAAGSPAPPSS